MTMPSKVEVIEVGPRDGFQNVKEWIPTETKLEIIDNLFDAGFRRMEVTSFVHPKAIPQMAEAAEVMKSVKGKYGDSLTAIALVPNLFGAKKAIEAGADELTFVTSASERHNLENIRQTHEQSIKALNELCQIKGNVKVRLAIATSFDCPFTGRVPTANVIKLVEAGLAACSDDIYLADTIGTANPKQTAELITIIQEKYPKLPITLHMHDTQGMGLANVLTAMRLGVTRFETAIAGLGGCPFAPGAAGNIATEDLINMVQAMDIETGIDLAKLISLAKMIGKKLPVKLLGHMARVDKPCTVTM